MKYLGITQEEVAVNAPDTIAQWVREDDPDAYSDPPTQHWLAEIEEDIDFGYGLMKENAIEDMDFIQYATIIGEAEFVYLHGGRTALFIPRRLADAKPEVWEEFHRCNPHH